MSNNSKVVVIEDEESISNLVCLYLKKSDIETKQYFNAEDALKELSKENLPDLILLDLNLPGMSGFDFLKTIKEKFSLNMPSVMILSARDTDEDIIKGLGVGADEFITKPFSPSVLVARIQANLRRQSSATAKAEDSIVFDDYTLLLNSCVLKKGNAKIPLSTKEYEVLEYLVKNAGQILSPEKIYQDVWKVEFGDITAVAVYIQRLRKKLESNGKEMYYIKTEFGKGYIFNKDCIQRHEN
ncbi:MAG: response regulator transcription factor [Treponema sp.]|nr:response regulator transcription factor [Treponema sp.]